MNDGFMNFYPRSAVQGIVKNSNITGPQEFRYVGLIIAVIDKKIYIIKQGVEPYKDK